MKLTYEMIFSILNSKCNIIQGVQKNYFVDDSQRIMATFDKKLSTVTMFYDFQEHSKEIWNHEGKVAIVFARDFNVNGQICDIICIEGLCGACNDFIMQENFAIDTTNNTEMRYLFEDKEGLQEKFERLSYKNRISILESATGATFTGANIEGVQLFADSDKYALGNCGYLCANNGIASFDICGVVEVKNIVVNKQDNGYDINIIDCKGTQEVNYDEVYNFYRKKNEWHYDKDGGYNTAGSLETREFTERRRFSTIDADAIHLQKSAIDSLLNSIYEKNNQSLNAKRLQMIYTLNLLLDNKRESIKYISTHYNFNMRNCDYVRQKVKK